jgi:hypothetical protein
MPEFYARYPNGEVGAFRPMMTLPNGIDLDLQGRWMRVAMESTKRCLYCGHSRAAHTDGVHCALCRCRSERVETVQESFAFRGIITPRSSTGRKR